MKLNSKYAACACFLLVPAVALVGQRYTAAPDGPATAPNSGFPVHVHIIQTHWNHINGGYQGFGRADIVGDKPTGLDFTYSCSEPFLHNAQREEFYQARWKKENQSLDY